MQDLDFTGNTATDCFVACRARLRGIWVYNRLESRIKIGNFYPSPKCPAQKKYRLSTELGQLRRDNGHLVEALAAAKVGSLKLEQHAEAAVKSIEADVVAALKSKEADAVAALKSKEADAAAAAAREKALLEEMEQAQTRADAMSQSLVEVSLGFW